MTPEQSFLKKCNEAFPGISSKSELSFQQLQDFMTEDSSGQKVATGAQHALLKELTASRTFVGTPVENRFELNPPATASKLAVAATECIRIDKNEKKRVLDEAFASQEILPTVEQKLTEAILKKGPSAWAPVLKLEGNATMSGGGYRLPEWFPPPLSSREEIVRKVLQTLPHVEVVVTQDDSSKINDRPTFDLSVRLKEKGK